MNSELRPGFASPFCRERAKNVQESTRELPGPLGEQVEESTAKKTGRGKKQCLNAFDPCVRAPCFD